MDDDGLKGISQGTRHTSREEFRKVAQRERTDSSGTVYAVGLSFSLATSAARTLQVHEWMYSKKKEQTPPWDFPGWFKRYVGKLFTPATLYLLHSPPNRPYNHQQHLSSPDTYIHTYKSVLWRWSCNFKEVKFRHWNGNFCTHIRDWVGSSSSSCSATTASKRFQFQYLVPAISIYLAHFFFSCLSATPINCNCTASVVIISGSRCMHLQEEEDLKLISLMICTHAFLQWLWKHYSISLSIGLLFKYQFY